MSRPLELTVYPKLERPLYGHQIEGYRQQVKAESALKESKRLTDAELAAEWQQEQRHMAVAVICGQPDALTKARRADTLHRFATLPHYDEPGHD
ncbi:hypothetical protein [Arthrobacter sp. FW306-06-A]|uniref:hypothetical protein n=1 Tax=Arthrobacter sp. FW306-06-A TaxID=2879621 RepID=UPI001F19D490|nr:hypothetical protein [Arthrobacter sp. FW306-06-A]UKA69543.1 hypothetical protein LFT49_12245 [Arthrobacter sp. FW306-06-A]